MKIKNLLLCFSILAINVAFANQTYDEQKIADIFYQLNGDPKDPHKKVNHSKGFCASGEFVVNKNGISNIDLPLFLQNKIPVDIRYSLGGGNMDDKSKPRGMAINFNGDKESWTMVMLNTEINFAKNPQEFGQFFEMRIPVNGKVNNEKIAKLTKEVDSYRNFDKYLQNIGISSIENTPFYSIHTFYFKSNNGELLPAKWKFIPQDGIKYLSDEQLAKLDKDFLATNFQNYTKNKPVKYDMYLVLANKGDILDDTTALWSGKHKEILVGTLNVTNYNGTSCNSDVYFPSNLPTGVEPPKDPLFNLRSPTYSITFGKRQ
ncbi:MULTISPECIES: catalase family peroxidase [Helicobacter]|uniref:Catalase-related peroxidase n=1 Tax=Helicobacter ibis TaxID=2962633 RepID=A0ABT4VDW3_9HELI|nr:MULTISPECIES: catalase family peroxidase [Helicobacter]MDA3966504.1 catalase family peroxidase [Helicobacter sp. WB40]MDA3968880.1 catalase family peroxidase [Helicobacter ibis]